MNILYSTYEAKARFSEVMRLVREGGTVTVTYRGDPVAEIRPIKREANSVEEHFAGLEKRGIVVPAKDPHSPLRAGLPKPGSLARFLAERGE
ncbi:MAG: type II toxin-antitoxin system prevent-host-death family antitoxin [Gemmatimonadetes bacterium]|nr:type II toxin-antitoxin system prevent-host-death family antitoxin [Gemmatimonadota bacterium]